MLTIKEQMEQWEKDRKTGWLGMSLLAGAMKLRIRKYPGETKKEFKERINRERQMMIDKENDPRLYNGRYFPVRYDE